MRFNTLSEIKNNVNVENENEKISSKQNNSPQVQVQQQTNNISLQNKMVLKFNW